MSNVTTYYVQTDLINDLTEHYGSRFERISKRDKWLMLSAIALYHAHPACLKMQSEDENFNWVEAVLESVDPDHICDESVREAIEVLLENEDEKTLMALSVALAEQLSAGCYTNE
jgi:hypothetical protein